MKTLLTLLSSLTTAATLLAQTAPSLMNYQGRLTDEAGNPLTNGQYRLAFRLFTNTIPIANEPLIWGREYEASLIGGVFNVVLGAAGGAPVAEPAAVNDLSFAFTAPNRFLELRVLRDAASNIVNRTILPRQQLLSAPYAFVASSLIKEFQDALCPPGTIIAFGGHTNRIPDGWLLCDGSSVSNATYPKLYNAISTNWGAGAVANEFRLPELRGMFLRGVSGNSTGPYTDADAANRFSLLAGGKSGNDVGSYQESRNGEHTHGGSTGSANGTLTAQVYVNANWNVHARHRTITAWNANDQASEGAPLASATGATRGAIVVGETSANNIQTSESRPVNAYVHYIIKY